MARPKFWLYLSVCAIMVLGLWLRARNLAEVPPTGDEAESSINALTILQTGLPRGTYLDLPIYENVLTEPWPEHPEYEFRDSSYSREKDLAIYHGWLPLYSMAASQKLMGVTPDEPSGELKVRHTDAEMYRRVIAARLPAVVFGVLFMIFLFLGAKEMFGVDAAIAALVVGAVGRPFVYMAREARYHSATLALTTAACWVTWRVYRYGRWSDYLLLSTVLVLLFYTHLLGFMIACMVFGLLSPLLLFRRQGALPKLAVTGVVIASFITPWILYSGFLTQTTHIPPARVFLSFPADLIYYPLVRVPYLILPVLCVLWLGIVLLFHRRLPAHVTRPIHRHWKQIGYLLLWITVGILAFTLLIPAASYFYKRLTLAVMGPGVIWAAIIFAAGARAWKPQHSTVTAAISFLIAVTLGNMAHLYFLEPPDIPNAYKAVTKLRTLSLAPDTKLYCTPNDQLSLQYLTGLPIQSIAPIRKSFLDTYPGPMLIIDSAVPYEIVSSVEIRKLTKKWGYNLTKQQAKELEGPMSAWALRQELPQRVGAPVIPPDFEVPPFADQIADYQRTETARSLAKFKRKGANNPMLRHYDLRDWADWWPLFFYRFVEPEKRMHEHLNYLDRVRGGQAEVLDTSWVMYHCPPLAQTAGGTDSHKEIHNGLSTVGSAPKSAR